MSKTSTIITGAVIAVVLTAGVSAYVKAENNNTLANRQEIIQEAVDEGIIDQKSANKLSEYTRAKRNQMTKERIQEKINNALENGTITQEEAQQIIDWHNSKPEAMKKIGGRKMNRENRMNNHTTCPYEETEQN